MGWLKEQVVITPRAVGAPYKLDTPPDPKYILNQQSISLPPRHLRLTAWCSNPSFAEF